MKSPVFVFYSNSRILLKPYNTKFVMYSNPTIPNLSSKAVLHQMVCGKTSPLCGKGWEVEAISHLKERLAIFQTKPTATWGCNEELREAWHKSKIKGNMQMRITSGAQLIVSYY